MVMQKYRRVLTILEARIGGERGGRLTQCSEAVAVRDEFHDASKAQFLESRPDAEKDAA